MARAPKEPDGRGRRGPGHTRWLPGSGLALGLQSQCAPASAWPPTSPPSGLCLRGALGAGELSASAPCGLWDPKTSRSRDPGRSVLPGSVRGIAAGKSVSPLSGVFGDRTRPGGTRRASARKLRGAMPRAGAQRAPGQEKTAQPGSPPREQSHGPLRWCVNSGCILALILLSS